VLRPDRVGHEFLGVLENPLRGSPVVQASGGEYVGAEHSCPKYLDHPLIGAACLLVPRWRKRYVLSTLVVGQRRQHRCL
jgi:hypothetical protein